MNCPVCGGPYILGSDRHAECRKLEEARLARDREIDEMLEWWREHTRRRIPYTDFPDGGNSR